MYDVHYGTVEDAAEQEISRLYERLGHELVSDPARIREMINNSTAFVTARVGGELVGFARGLCDGVRGLFVECKLDPVYQGPAAVTRTDGRIEHDQYGIAAEMARRVLDRLRASGAVRIDVLAWGTEVDFLQELGFKKAGGMVALTMKGVDAPAATQLSAASGGN